MLGTLADISVDVPLLVDGDYVDWTSGDWTNKYIGGHPIFSIHISPHMHTIVRTLDVFVYSLFINFGYYFTLFIHEVIVKFI